MTDKHPSQWLTALHLDSDWVGNFGVFFLHWVGDDWHPGGCVIADLKSARVALTYRDSSVNGNGGPKGVM